MRNCSFITAIERGANAAMSGQVVGECFQRVSGHDMVDDAEAFRALST